MNSPDANMAPRGRLQLTLGRVPMAIVLITVLSAATVVHLSWGYAYHRSIDSLTRQLNTRIIAGITNRVGMLLETAAANVSILHDLLLNGVADPTGHESRERLFLTILQSDPTFSWVTLGFPNGDFFGTQRLDSGKFRSVTRTWNPETSLARSDIRFFQRDESSLILTHAASDELRYFAPERAWYRDALLAGDKVWTDVYIYASSKQPGIDVAMPLEKNGRTIGVVAIGMELGQISEYLGGLAVGKTGTAFIVNRRGELIAYRDATEVVVKGQTGNKLQLGRLSSARAPLLRVAADALKMVNLANIQAETQRMVTPKETNLPSGHRGMEHLVTLAPSGHGDWLIGTVIHTEEFMAEVRTIQNQLLLVISTAIFLLSLLILTLTRTFLVRPLERITGLTADIGRCDVERSVMVSPIVEIQSLATAMARMERDLCALRDKEQNDAKARLEQEQSFARLNQQMRSASDMAALCEAGLRFLIEELAASIGAIYLVTEENRLQLQAGYALDPEHPPQGQGGAGDGWLGQVVTE